MALGAAADPLIVGRMFSGMKETEQIRMKRKITQMVPGPCLFRFLEKEWEERPVP